MLLNINGGRENKGFLYKVLFLPEVKINIEWKLRGGGPEVSIKSLKVVFVLFINTIYILKPFAIILFQKIVSDGDKEL